MYLVFGEEKTVGKQAQSPPSGGNSFFLFFSVLMKRLFYNKEREGKKTFN